MENVILNCEFCNYTTNRKFNLKRHHNAVHNVKTPINDDSKNHINLEKKHKLEFLNNCTKKYK